MHRAYLDCAATTPIAPEVRAAMEPWFSESYGNPSSPHRDGVAAAEALDRARRQVARAVAAPAPSATFTSGGTEANNLAVLGFARARARHGRHVLVGPTEHASVRAAAEALREEDFEVESAQLDAGGGLDLEQLAVRLRRDTVLVAQMLVSNELGTVYPIGRLARLVRGRAPHAALHVDAVQALGKLELSLAELGADSIALSAHKVRGPKGAGALVLAPGAAPPRPLIFGGGQESGLRAGTENVAALAGFGLAAELAEEQRAAGARTLEKLRAHFVAGLARIPGAHLLEPGHLRVPGIVAVLVDGPPAEVLVHHLDARGVAASAGSACQARTGAISPTLTALGLDAARARRVLRFSFGRETTHAELDLALTELERCLTELAGAAQ